MNVAFQIEKTTRIQFDSEKCGCNVPDDVYLEQVNSSIRRGLPQAYPHEPNATLVALVCGGPSLEETLPELVRLYWNGAKVVAVNGAYQWCIDHNIKPSAMVMLDGREFNSRFVETPVDGCTYMLASQCHPCTFDICADRDVLLWHACSGGDPELQMLKEFYFDRVYPVTIGTTVSVRGISLLRMLGMCSFEIFGLDSCWLEDKHHSYTQSENDKDLRIPVWLTPGHKEEGHRLDKAVRFYCAPWHMKQLEDVQELIRNRGDLFRLNFHGPGLIATMIRTGFELQKEK